MENRIGQTFGDYRILRETGDGEIEQVYLAENIHHKKQYALKVLPDHLSMDKGFRDRFLDEARVVSDLDHPNIVKVHHFGEDKGVFFLVMDYIKGPKGCLTI